MTEFSHLIFFVPLFGSLIGMMANRGKSDLLSQMLFIVAISSIASFVISEKLVLLLMIFLSAQGLIKKT